MTDLLRPSTIGPNREAVIDSAYAAALRVELVPSSSAEADARWESFLASQYPLPLSWHPGWLDVFQEALGHKPYRLEALREGRTVGLLPLSLVRGRLFGRTLSSMPYLNYGGAIAEDNTARTALIDRAIGLSESLRFCPLLLRHDRAVQHPRLARHPANKVNVRRDLPTDAAKLETSLLSATRNQVRKGRKNGLTVHWGGEELLDDFYRIFSVNMRDLGTPVYGRGLFRGALRRFPGRAELCVVRQGPLAIAGAFLTHGWGVTEVPSASSLRSHNKTCANMLMYWHLLARTVERGQLAFDFGRCTPDSSVFKFKEQWGGRACPAEWEIGHASVGRSASPHRAGRGRLTRVWSRLPLALANTLGPPIVRQVP